MEQELKELEKLSLRSGVKADSLACINALVLALTSKPAGLITP